MNLPDTYATKINSVYQLTHSAMLLLCSFKMSFCNFAVVQESRSSEEGRRARQNEAEIWTKHARYKKMTVLFIVM
jgi:hypothetical protein